MRRRTAMKRISIVIVAFCFVAFATVAQAQSYALRSAASSVQLQPVQVAPQPITRYKTIQPTGSLKQANPPLGPVDFNAVYMVDDDIGWAVGDGGVILKTEDGGRTWSQQSSGTTEDLLGVDSFDGVIAYAVGEANTILRTEDGGRTWYDPRRYAAYSSWIVLQDVHLLSEDTAIVVGGTSRSPSTYLYGYVATYLRTTDGGVTWTTPSYPAGLERINAVDFIDDQVGIAVGGCISYSLYYRTFTFSSIVTTTRDGGLTWTKEESPFDIGSEPYGIEPWGKRIWDVAFYDEVHAALVATEGVPIALSADEGHSWGSAGGSICGFEEQSITYVDADTLVAVGEGLVSRSTDGGLNWEFAYEVETDDCFCLKSVSAAGRTVVVVGCDSRILRSDDGGATWQEVRL